MHRYHSIHVFVYLSGISWWSRGLIKKQKVCSWVEGSFCRRVAATCNSESHVQVSEPGVDYIVENEHFESQTLRFGSDHVPLDDFLGACFFLRDVPGPSLKPTKQWDWKMSFLFGSWPPDRCQMRVHVFSTPENDGFCESFGRCQVATQLYKLVAEEGHGWGDGRSCTVGSFYRGPYGWCRNLSKGQSEVL